MRLHLVIERHGLPVTRVLWTTHAPGARPPTAPTYAAPSSTTLASTRHPDRALAASASLRAARSGGLTIAQLLEDVDNVFPLQAADGDSLPGGAEDGSADYSGQFWTLEDYVVEVAGSECLHFMEVDGILRDEDEVVIRPLQPEEVRARRLTGRTQISAQGWHLIDGVPFGQRFTRRATVGRPPVRIPIRKRRRLMYEDVEELEGMGGEEELRRLGFDEEYVPEEEEDEDDEEYEYEEGDAEDELDDLSYAGSDLDEQAAPFAEEYGSDYAEEEQQEQQEDQPPFEESRHLPRQPAWAFLPGPVFKCKRRPAEQDGAPPVDELEIAYESEPEERAEAEAERAEASGTKRAARAAHAHGAARAQTVSSTDDFSADDEAYESSSSESSSSSSSTATESSTAESNEESAPEPAHNAASSPPSITIHAADDDEPTKPKPQKYAPPGSGSSATRYSNSRAKMRRRLQRLKSAGLLGEKANFEELRRWEEMHPDGHPALAAVPLQAALGSQVEGEAAPQAEQEDASQAEEEAALQQEEQEAVPQQEEEDAALQQEEQTVAEVVDEKAALEAKRAQLLAALDSGGIDVDADDISSQDHHSIHGSATNSNSDVASEGDDAPEKAPIGKKSTATFISAPRSVKLAKAAQKAAKRHPRPTRQAVFSEAAVMTQPSDAWKEKLVLGATECVYHDVEMTAPPFPFEQRWDKQAGQAMFAARNAKDPNKQSKRKRASRFVEDFAPAPTNDTDTATSDTADDPLDYGDDDAASRRPVTHGSDTSAMPSVSGSDDVCAGLSLPADVRTLPPLLQPLAKPNAVIAFKRMGLMPQGVGVSRHYVGRIVRTVEGPEGDAMLTLMLAESDLLEIEAQSEDSVWKKFQPPGGGEGEGKGKEKTKAKSGGGLHDINFKDMIQAKLVAPAEAGFSSW